MQVMLDFDGSGKVEPPKRVDGAALIVGLAAFLLVWGFGQDEAQTASGFASAPLRQTSGLRRRQSSDTGHAESRQRRGLAPADSRSRRHRRLPRLPDLQTRHHLEVASQGYDSASCRELRATGFCTRGNAANSLSRFFLVVTLWAFTSGWCWFEVDFGVGRFVPRPGAIHRATRRSLNSLVWDRV